MVAFCICQSFPECSSIRQERQQGFFGNIRIDIREIGKRPTIEIVKAVKITNNIKFNEVTTTRIVTVINTIVAIAISTGGGLNGTHR